MFILPGRYFFSNVGKKTIHTALMEESENVTSNLTKMPQVEENMATTVNIVVRLILIVFGTIGNVYLRLKIFIQKLQWHESKSSIQSQNAETHISHISPIQIWIYKGDTLKKHN